MINIHYFTFSPFEENTYVLWDETNEAVIIDPGCLAQYEKEELGLKITAEFLNEKADDVIIDLQVTKIAK